MKVRLEEAVRDVTSKDCPSAEELRQLQALLAGGGPDDARVPGRWRWLAVAASLAVAALAVLWLGPPGGLENRVPVLADEIAMNHIAAKSLDLEARTVAELREPFATLGFVLQPLPPERDFGQLEGGRFCSVQTVPAALLRYQLEPGTPGHGTVYQAPYLPALHGKLPDVDRGERPVLAMSRGVAVELWTSRGLLFAIAREDTGAP